ncbi:MAG: hypothetical protein IJR51_07865 [Clostridia bacterium]|nr:hypothetical protein [Clostridia bacterium]MBR5423917.1 hypothetical protein [Clostridia bacterium]
MAALRQEYDYNFDMFGGGAGPVRQSAARSAAAAAPARKTKPRVPLQVVPEKTPRQQQKEARTSLMNAMVILIFAAAILGVLCLQITSGAKSYELSRQIAAVESEIEVAKSENVRLNSELNGITSIGRIDDYATRILGMKKMEAYQVEYIDLSEGDGVIYSSGGGFLQIFSNP